MEKETFLRHLETMLELDPMSLTGREVLSEMAAWDSLAVLGIIAFFDSELHKSVDAVAVAQAVTLDDVYALAGQ